MPDLDKQKIKKHFGLYPKDTWIDNLIIDVQDAGPIQAEVEAAIAACDAALSALRAAESEANSVMEACDAKFNYTGAIAIRRRQYRELVNDLARLIGYPQTDGCGSITGVINL